MQKLSQEQKKDFQERGFIVLKGFFDTEVVDRLSSWLDELSQKAPGDGAEAKYYEKSPISDEDLLVRAEYLLGEHNPEITDLLLNERTLSSLEDLFGEAPVLFKEKANYKLPGCRPDKLHQDQAAGWNAYTDFYISMAIVVDENRKDNAALSFMCSGNYDKSLMSDEWTPLTMDDPPYQPEDEYMLLEAQPGDVVFFDSYVPHGSPANTSDSQRRNIYLTFNKASDGDLRQQYYDDKWKSYPPNQVSTARTDTSFRV
jgi:ectoine hydroxylase-related dioxygenase (phytanoyl-CoA dioxygenase family)